MDSLLDAAADAPYLYVVYIAVVAFPIILFLCLFGPPPKGEEEVAEPQRVAHQNHTETVPAPKHEQVCIYMCRY